MIMDENEFRNLAYKAIIPVMENIEHNDIPIKNGHHLTQRLTKMLWNEFKNRNI
jgi:hypothetical protein